MAINRGRSVAARVRGLPHLPSRLCGHLGLAATLACIATSALPVSASAGGSCPNETLRSEDRSLSLPDCRAYEQVTPPFKNGSVPITTTLLDGSDVVFQSLGGFGNPPANPSINGASYLARRAPVGWSSLSLEAPLSAFESGESGKSPLVDLSSSFAESISIERPVSSSPVDQRLYLRRPDGSFGLIGPIVPPTVVAAAEPGSGRPVYAYEGASRDLSHVFFDLGSTGNVGQSFTWPGDTTVRTESSSVPSLYEYVGVGHTGEGSDVPRLVGRDNAGHLISQCGTTLGSGHGGSDYNAISSDGATVYFTALAMDTACENSGGTVAPAVNELFARINGLDAVSISEPDGEDCAECNTASPQAAEFQGASEDGSKVFFLTEQPLLPGAEGKNLYEYNFSAPAGEKVSLVAPHMLGVVRVSEQGTGVYFTSEAIVTAQRNSFGDEAQPGEPNLYLYVTAAHQSTFVATLSPADEGDWQSLDARTSQATPDGRFLLFASSRNLSPDASGAGIQLYRYDAHTRVLVRVSIGNDGFNNNGNNSDFALFPQTEYFPAEGPGTSPQPSVAPQATSISDDGSYVVFFSPAALTPQAISDSPAPPGTDEIYNVYEFHEGHVYLLSDGQDRKKAFGNPATRLLGASPSGSDIYFTTADSLVPQDSDGQVDIYDARVGGGFRAPIAPPSCSGEACQGGPSVGPAISSPGSVTFSGSGNLALPISTPGTPKAKPLTRAQKLVKALKACRAKHDKRKRARCERQAREKYGPTHKAKTAHPRGK